MKIIGKTGDGWSAEFIVTAKKTELAEIMGFTYEGDPACPEIDIGKTIPVSTIFAYLKLVAAADKNIKSAAQTLKAVADLAETIIPMFPPENAEDK